MLYTGIREPLEFRIITRAHVIAYDPGPDFEVDLELD